MIISESNDVNDYSGICMIWYPLSLYTRVLMSRKVLLRLSRCTGSRTQQILVPARGGTWIMNWNLQRQKYRNLRWVEVENNAWPCDLRFLGPGGWRCSTQVQTHGMFTLRHSHRHTLRVTHTHTHTHTLTPTHRPAPFQTQIWSQEPKFWHPETNTQTLTLTQIHKEPKQAHSRQEPARVNSHTQTPTEPHRQTHKNPQTHTNKQTLKNCHPARKSVCAANKRKIVEGIIQFSRPRVR